MVYKYLSTNIGSLMEFAELLEEEVTELLRLNKYGINI